MKKVFETLLYVLLVITLVKGVAALLTNPMEELAGVGLFTIICCFWAFIFRDRK